MKSAHLEADGKLLPSNTTLNPRGAAKLSHADAWSLPIEMRKRVKGEVRFDDGSRALYATDGSNYRQTPIGVVLPKSREDVINAIEVARQFGAPITGRGCGTSLAGQCCNVAVILDMSKYFNRVLEIDVARKLGRVEPGCILDELARGSEKARAHLRP